MIKQKSFTLIELLVVIVIIGILAGVIMISTSSSIDKANFAKAQTFSNTVQEELLLNLVSEWTFDNSSNIGEDTWGNNNGTLYNFDSPATSTSGLASANECVSGTCLKFDGVDDYIDIIGSNLSINPLAITGAITLSSWVKFNNNGTDGTIIARGKALSSAGNYGYTLSRYEGNNCIYFDTYSTTTRDALNSANISITNDNNWHLVIATWDGTINTNGKKLYIDGVLANQKSSTISTIGQPNYSVLIGNSGGAAIILNGLIDDTRIYNEAISYSQIKKNYIAGLNSMLSNGNISKQEYNEKI